MNPPLTQSSANRLCLWAGIAGGIVGASIDSVNDFVRKLVARVLRMVMIKLKMNEPSGRQAVLAAFDQLFDKAAGKLRLEIASDDKQRAMQSFSERFAMALQIADRITFPAVPEGVMAEMEAAIEDLSPAQLVGYIAAAPLAVKMEEIARHLALVAAQQRLLDHVLEQADDSFGGN